MFVRLGGLAAGDGLSGLAGVTGKLGAGDAAGEATLAAIAV